MAPLVGQVAARAHGRSVSVAITGTAAGASGMDSRGDVPVREGGTIAEAFAASAELARTAEAAGYRRFWIAEHHAMEGIAGGATSVANAHIGSVTSARVVSPTAAIVSTAWSS